MWRALKDANVCMCVSVCVYVCVYVCVRACVCIQYIQDSNGAVEKVL